jgi:hypothetical protein
MTRLSPDLNPDVTLTRKHERVVHYEMSEIRVSRQFLACPGI